MTHRLGLAEAAAAAAAAAADCSAAAARTAASAGFFGVWRAAAAAAAAGVGIALEAAIATVAVAAAAARAIRAVAYWPVIAAAVGPSAAIRTERWPPRRRQPRRPGRTVTTVTLAATNPICSRRAQPSPPGQPGGGASALRDQGPTMNGSRPAERTVVVARPTRVLFR